MITSLILLVPMVAPQVVTDVILTLNLFMHSTTLLLIMFIMNVCVTTPAEPLTVSESPL